MAKLTGIRVVTDVGGTFTDLVYFRTDPKTIVWNVLGGLHPEIQRVLQQRQAFIETQVRW